MVTTLSMALVLMRIYANVTDWILNTCAFLFSFLVYFLYNSQAFHYYVLLIDFWFSLLYENSFSFSLTLLKPMLPIIITRNNRMANSCLLHYVTFLQIYNVFLAVSPFCNTTNIIGSEINFLLIILKKVRIKQGLASYWK